MYKIIHTDPSYEIRIVGLVKDIKVAEAVVQEMTALAGRHGCVSTRDQFHFEELENYFEGTPSDISKQILEKYFW